MIDDFNKAIAEYRQKWQQLIAERQDKRFFEALTPTAACWKAEGMSDLDRRVNELRDHADHIHWGWINERWLVTMHLRNQELAWGVKIAKLYQRRPGSADATGLDHVDFYAPAIDEDMLTDEPDLRWTHESNSELSKWISIWFSGTEAKLRTNTTLDVVVAELQGINKKLVG